MNQITLRDGSPERSKWPTLLVLALGVHPAGYRAIGILAMYRLRALPESLRLAGGQK